MLCFFKYEYLGTQSHLFCFECIEAWSKTENTCPLCKKRFSSIDQSAAITNETNEDSNMSCRTPAKGKGRGAKKSKEKVKKVRVKKRSQADAHRAAQFNPFHDFLFNFRHGMQRGGRAEHSVFARFFDRLQQHHSHRRAVPSRPSRRFGVGDDSEDSMDYEVLNDDDTYRNMSGTIENPIVIEEEPTSISFSSSSSSSSSSSRAPPATSSSGVVVDLTIDDDDDITTTDIICSSNVSRDNSDTSVSSSTSNSSNVQVYDLC